MAIRNIVKIGDPLLREASVPVTKFDNSLAALIDDMFETMDYENGVGLAAVQVGVLRRIFVVDAGEKRLEFVNPIITNQEGKQTSTEGCLSIPNRHDIVLRPQRVFITAFNRYGEKFTMQAEDFLAIVLCHEADHLDGIVFTDRIQKNQ